MPIDEVRDRVCPVCSQFIPEGAALTFMRRDNLIHAGCLVAAQRRAEAPPSKAPASTSLDGRAEDWVVDGDRPEESAAKTGADRSS